LTFLDVWKHDNQERKGKKEEMVEDIFIFVKLPPPSLIDRTFGFPEYGHKAGLGIRLFP